MNKIHLQQIINNEVAGFRLDQALAKLFPQFSRAQMQHWILGGKVKVDNKIVIKNKERVFPGQMVELSVQLEDKEEWQPEAIPLNIVFEDESLLVINKPAGLVVHPGAGNPNSTLVNALLHHFPELKKVPRAGLIHRLDKDTSGLLIVARHLSAHHLLFTQMQQREIHRSYVAVVSGTTRPVGTVDLPIGRHLTQRTKMSVVSQGGKAAKTHFKLLAKFPLHSYLEVNLETGRTHQIRVHLAHIGHPILGDPLYGKKRNYTSLSEELRHTIHCFKRQALHAKNIAFTHPLTHQSLAFEAPLPADFMALLAAFENEMHH